MKPYNIQLNGDGNLYISKKIDTPHAFQVTQEFYDKVEEENKSYFSVADFYIQHNELEKFVQDLAFFLKEVKKHEKYKQISALKEQQLLWGYTKEREGEIEKLKSFLEK